MSLFRRIFITFAIVLFVAVLSGTLVEYTSARVNLPHLITKIYTEYIAASLSRHHSLNEGWENLEGMIDALGLPETTLGMQGADVPLKVHVVVRDSAGRTLYNSFTSITAISSDALVEGETMPLTDPATESPVGSVTTYVNSAFLEAEAADFLRHILPSRLLHIAGMLSVTALVAWFITRRITSPIVSLSKALDSLGRREEAVELPRTKTVELRRMTESFERLNAALEAQRESRRHLIADLSHELNTPLSVISLEARGALDGFKPADSALRQVISEIDELASLMADLDWLAETDTGDLQLDLSSWSLEELVRKETDRWSTEAASRGISLKLTLPHPDLPVMNLDGERIARVLGNLILNALKYSNKGDSVNVELRRDGPSVLTVVSDTGIGIPPEHLERIFDRLYRVDNDRSRVSGGQGIGLSIVKRVAELHGGRVWAESTPGEGSRFFLSLPLNDGKRVQDRHIRNGSS